MAQNRDRNWQDRDQQSGRGMSGGMGRGGRQDGEDFGQGEHGQHQGFAESQDHEQFGSGTSGSSSTSSGSRSSTT